MKEAHAADERGYVIMHENQSINVERSEDILNLLGKKYSLLIIGILGIDTTMKFNDIKKILGCPSSNILTARLREMNSAEIIDRNVVQSSPISVMYSLTKKGIELRKNLIPLFSWIEYNCPRTRLK